MVPAAKSSRFQPHFSQPPPPAQIRVICRVRFQVSGLKFPLSFPCALALNAPIFARSICHLPTVIFIFPTFPAARYFCFRFSQLSHAQIRVICGCLRFRFSNFGLRPLRLFAAGISGLICPLCAFALNSGFRFPRFRFSASPLGVLGALAVHFRV